MTNLDYIIEELLSYNAQTAKSISCRIFDKRKVKISPRSVTAQLSALVKQGKVANSNCGNKEGTVWWLTDNFKNTLK